jgi:hypothetical protein
VGLHSLSPSPFIELFSKTPAIEEFVQESSSKKAVNSVSEVSNVMKPTALCLCVAKTFCYV